MGRSILGLKKGRGVFEAGVWGFERHGCVSEAVGRADGGQP